MSQGPHRVSITVDPAAVIAPVNRRLFGSFVEHMGRGIYGGLFEPGHHDADEDGFRTDVLALVKELGVSIIRYPGGNFVSGYRWEDGVGPLDRRPARFDRAWRSVEPNTFGLDEMARWSAKAGTDIMLAINLGTRGVAAAADLLDYANTPEGTPGSELRRRHGRRDPYGIRTWCLGNEMDGPWQNGHKQADEYGRLAAETAVTMRELDPTVELVVCGSSATSMPTFGTWDETVLEHTYEVVDLISAHAYYDPEASDLPSFVASSAAMEDQINRVLAIADRVGRRKDVGKRLGISFDEWNVWYMGRHQSQQGDLEWKQAPRLCEDDYTLSDAVVVGSLLITLLRHCDRVAVACQAQLVNVIAPIHTEPGGQAERRAIFHPFSLTSRFAVGDVLDTSPAGPAVPTQVHGEVTAYDGVVTHDATTGVTTAFSVNRSTTDPIRLGIDLSPFPGARVVEHVLIDGGTSRPIDGESNSVGPQPAPWHQDRGQVSLLLPPISWSMLRIAG